MNSHSVVVQRLLLDSIEYAQAKTIVLYAAKDNEVETYMILADALATGRRVLFPKVLREKRELSLVKVDSRSELVAGAFGVQEPTGTEIVLVTDLGQALICVPGLAFSPSGHRVGRGGGYYDRLLTAAGLPARSAGLAFSFQVLDRLPQSPTDWRLNLIVSESALYFSRHGEFTAGAG